jgi:hypothetical protein
MPCGLITPIDGRLIRLNELLCLLVLMSKPIFIVVDPFVWLLGGMRNLFLIVYLVIGMASLQIVNQRRGWIHIGNSLWGKGVSTARYHVLTKWLGFRDSDRGIIRIESRPCPSLVVLPVHESIEIISTLFRNRLLRLLLIQGCSLNIFGKLSIFNIIIFRPRYVLWRWAPKGL